MKKLGICLVIFILVGTSCHTQSNVTLTKYKERYNEIKTNAFESGWSGTAVIWANYAGSNITLARYKERYNEIQTDGFESGFESGWLGTAVIWANYAR
jgi:NADH:ubiquinone oxidoreductase subunit 3 (subunit A)